MPYHSKYYQFVQFGSHIGDLLLTEFPSLKRFEDLWNLQPCVHCTRLCAEQCGASHVVIQELRQEAYRTSLMQKTSSKKGLNDDHVEAKVHSPLAFFNC